MGRWPLSPEERFWDKVYFPPCVDDCWVWLGSTSTNGYGKIYVNGKSVRTHRFSYELAYGDIPEELVLDHLCRNIVCVNPSHLEAVPNAVNILRGVGAPAENARKTHCPQGHEYTTANIYWDRGKRTCRACKLAKRRSRI